jgi:ribosome-binding factor A
MHRELADLIRTSVKDPELGMITLSDVELTRDLSVAKLYVSFLGAKLSNPDCIKRLTESVPELRHQLGRRIRIRNLPELRLHFDDSIEKGMQMDSLLKELGGEAESGAEPSGEA